MPARQAMELANGRIAGKWFLPAIYVQHHP
jgi:hypothetical protein